MQVTLAIFVVDGDPSAYARQRTAIQNVLTKFGTNNIQGITGRWFIVLFIKSPQTDHHHWQLEMRYASSTLDLLTQ